MNDVRDVRRALVWPEEGPFVFVHERTWEFLLSKTTETSIPPPEVLEAFVPKMGLIFIRKVKPVPME